MATPELAQKPASGTVREDGRVFFRGKWQTAESVERYKAGARKRGKKYYRADNEKFARYREKHRLRIRQSVKKYHETIKGRASLMFYNAKGRAKKYGLEFALDRDWIEAKLATGYCEVTGFEFTFESTDTRYNPWSPSVDQIVPGAGYTKDNVQIVCTIHNTSKNEWGEADHRRYVEACARLYGLIE